MLDLSGVGGLPPSGASQPPVFIDPHWFSQKYIADPPLVLPQIEYWSLTYQQMFSSVSGKLRMHAEFSFFEGD